MTTPQAADEIVEKYLPYAFGSDTVTRYHRATHCAILEVKACINVCNEIWCQFPSAVAGEQGDKFEAILAELQSRIK